MSLRAIMINASADHMRARSLEEPGALFVPAVWNIFARDGKLLVLEAKQAEVLRRLSVGPAARQELLASLWPKEPRQRCYERIDGVIGRLRINIARINLSIINGAPCGWTLVDSDELARLTKGSDA